MWKPLFIGAMLSLAACGSGKEGVTELMLAARSGDADEAQRLIALGADVNAQSRFGWTPLIFASWQGHDAVVRVLLDAEANPDVVSGGVPATFSTTADYPPTTALAEAVRAGHLAIAKTLIEHGARTDPLSVALAGAYGDIPLLETMVERGADINQFGGNDFAKFPLYVAASNGNLQNVTWLIRNGADPNLLLSRATALHAAVYGDHPTVVLFLLENGADPNLVYGGGLRDTALATAVTKYTRIDEYPDNLSIIEMLLRFGADRSHRWREQESILEFALRDRARTREDIEANPRPDGGQELEIYNRRLASLTHHDAVIALLEE